MKINHKRMATTVLGVGLCAGLLSNAALAALYRWVDSDGKVHYSDSIPPSASQSGHAELNASGVMLKSVAAAKSAEQLAEEQWLKELEEKRRKVQEQQHYQDSQLLSSYSDVAQLDKSHASRVGMLRESRKQLEILHSKLVDELEQLRAQLLKAEPKEKTRLEGFIEAKLKSVAEYEVAIAQNLGEEKDMQLEFEKQRSRFLDLLERVSQEKASKATL